MLERFKFISRVSCTNVRELLIFSFNIVKQNVRAKLGNLPETFCNNVWQLCTDTVDIAVTSSPGSIVTETFTDDENVPIEMSMMECNVNQNPPFQFLAFTLPGFIPERDGPVDIAFLFKRNVLNIKLFAYVPILHVQNTNENEN